MTDLSAEALIEVPFHDVDVMDVAWHGHYVKYFELARCALLRRLDYDYPQMRDSGYAWPVVECYLKYVRPARYGQQLRARATLREWENRLRFDYEIRDAVSGERLRSLHEHNARVQAIALSHATGDAVAVSGAADGTVAVFSTANGELLQTLRGHTAAIRSVEFSMDGHYIVTASADRSVRLGAIRDGPFRFAAPTRDA